MSEATYIVCHELTGSRGHSKSIKSTRFLDWVRKPDGESDLAYRQLGFFGDRLLARAEVFVHTPVAFSATIDMVSLVEVTGPHGVHLLLAEYRLPTKTAARARELRRPGLAATQQHLKSAGFTLDRSSNVRSTVMSFGLDLTEDHSATDGWTSLQQPLKEQGPEREVYRVMVLLVAIERQLLTAAERALTSQRTAWGMHARRRVLRTLPRVPSTDSEIIAAQFRLLRDSLTLDVRREQVLDALEVRVRRLEFGAASAAAGFAVALALFDLFVGVAGYGF